MIIKCAICKKEYTLARLSSEDIKKGVGWCCWNCLTADPMPVELLDNKIDNILKEEE